MVRKVRPILLENPGSATHCNTRFQKHVTVVQKLAMSKFGQKGTKGLYECSLIDDCLSSPLVGPLRLFPAPSINPDFVMSATARPSSSSSSRRMKMRLTMHQSGGISMQRKRRFNRSYRNRWRRIRLCLNGLLHTVLGFLGYHISNSNNFSTLLPISLKFGNKVGPYMPFCLLKFEMDRFTYDWVTADRARSTQNRWFAKSSVSKIWCCAGKLALP